MTNHNENKQYVQNWEIFILLLQDQITKESKAENEAMGIRSDDLHREIDKEGWLRNMSNTFDSYQNANLVGRRAHKTNDFRCDNDGKSKSKQRKCMEFTSTDGKMSNRKLYLSKYRKEDGRYSLINNTGTVNLFAISINRFCVESPSFWRYAWSWVSSLSSLTLVCIELMALISLIHKRPFSSHIHHIASSIEILPSPKGDVWVENKCVNYMQTNPIENNSMLNKLVDVWESPSLYENKTRLDSQLDILKGKNSLLWERDCFLNVNKKSDRKIKYNQTVLATLGIDQHIGVFFIFVLLAYILSKRIKDAATENALLDFSTRSLPKGMKMPYSSSVINISNQIRIFLMPPVIGGAFAAICFSENRSIETKLFELLLVIGITEIEDMLSFLFIPPARKVIPEKLIQAAKNDDMVEAYYWQTSTLCFFATLVTTFVVIFMDYSLKTFAS